MFSLTGLEKNGNIHNIGTAVFESCQVRTFYCRGRLDGGLRNVNKNIIFSTCATLVSTVNVDMRTHV